MLIDPSSPSKQTLKSIALGESINEPIAQASSNQAKLELSLEKFGSSLKLQEIPNGSKAHHNRTISCKLQKVPLKEIWYSST